jgi:hypothetical protein
MATISFVNGYVGEGRRWTVLGLAIVVLLVIGVVVAASKSEAQKTGELRRIPGYNPGYSEDIGWGRPTISIDPDSQQFAIVRADQTPKVFRFDQLVAAEIERDGKSLTKTNRGSQVAGAAVGALLLGPAGLLLGGLTGSKRQEEKIKRLSLKLYTNDLREPVTEVPFYKDLVGQNADSFIIRNAAKRADEWYGRFQTILHTRA